MPTEEVARAESERGEIVLLRRDTGALELRVNGVFVMDTVETSTEQALAEAALAVVDEPRGVLVGGLGLGFTAHAVLADPRVEKVAVVEIEDAIVGWMRDATVPHGPAFLADERLTIVVADVRAAVAEATPASYDLVLLDVDNGPGYLVHDSNAEVYAVPFLRQLHDLLHDLLRPGGALVVWSAAPDRALGEAVEQVFGAVAPVPFDVQLQGRAEQYWLYQARR